ncbi:hypothetical protein AUQ37_03825 [Candidatus Methanomethylophilus sp. 1R26]|uniref:hypothetical protein n=1 Tax=Candidatus Methanomethylophilus sp. 1R26 TaxID=1769296 RepID=UPI0007372C21|nr:hypothetical protein [Candidatus Methanomethylophilus sp. 1R26]KUE73119.1 hypothetical protein AUQ37_03825 [Candidatus Methanomethylophilus sp. 1R26]
MHSGNALADSVSAVFSKIAGKLKTLGRRIRLSVENEDEELEPRDFSSQRTARISSPSARGLGAGYEGKDGNGSPVYIRKQSEDADFGGTPEYTPVYRPVYDDQMKGFETTEAPAAETDEDMPFMFQRKRPEYKRVDYTKTEVITGEPINQYSDDAVPDGLMDIGKTAPAEAAPAAEVPEVPVAAVVSDLTEEAPAAEVSAEVPEAPVAVIEEVPAEPEAAPVTEIPEVPAAVSVSDLTEEAPAVPAAAASEAPAEAAAVPEAEVPEIAEVSVPAEPAAEVPEAPAEDSAEPEISTDDIMFQLAIASTDAEALHAAIEEASAFVRPEAIAAEQSEYEESSVDAALLSEAAEAVPAAEVPAAAEAPSEPEQPAHPYRIPETGMLALPAAVSVEALGAPAASAPAIAAAAEVPVLPAPSASAPVTSTVVAVPRLPKKTLEELEAEASERQPFPEPSSEGIAAGEDIDYIVPSSPLNVAETRMTGTVSGVRTRTVTEIVDLDRDLLFTARGDMLSDEILSMDCTSDDDSELPEDGLEGYDRRFKIRMKPQPREAPRAAVQVPPVLMKMGYVPYRFTGDLRSLRH